MRVSLTLLLLLVRAVWSGGGTSGIMPLVQPVIDDDVASSAPPPSADAVVVVATDAANKAAVPLPPSRGRPITLRRTLVRAAKKAFRGGSSGFIAGAVQVLILMWLRTANNYQYRYGVSMSTALHDLYQQGGLGRFYRGWPYALVQGPLARFGSVAANDASIVIAAYCLGQTEAASKGVFATLLGSVLAGVWRLLIMPLDTCKTVLQVDGARGFQQLMDKVAGGNILALYSGALATILATVVAHYPWFFVHNVLDAMLAVPTNTAGLLLRSAVIGFSASAVSDTVSNSIRVVKTVKQTAAGDAGAAGLTYDAVIRKVLAEGGVKGLFGRGLLTRILANGIQSMLFTVIWKYLSTTVRFKPKGGAPTETVWAGTVPSPNLRATSLASSHQATSTTS